MSKRKTARPGVRDVSPVSIYSEVYGGKDLRLGNKLKLTSRPRYRRKNKTKTENGKNIEKDVKITRESNAEETETHNR